MQERCARRQGAFAAGHQLRVRRRLIRGEVSREGSGTSRCMTLRLFEDLEAPATRKRARADADPAGDATAGERPSASSQRAARIQPAARDLSKYKDQVKCEVCGRMARRDVLQRHVDTDVFKHSSGPLLLTDRQRVV